ncbi:hypothetical protein QW131_00740 [Roseibium salinum]|nr:hypothetical protein [Roseibium salinum]
MEEQPELEVHILVWSTAVLHGFSGMAALLFGAGWMRHPRDLVAARHNASVLCLPPSEDHSHR